MAVHQCAQFCNNLRLVHGCAVRRIAKYLASTSTYADLPDVNQQLSPCGVVYNPNKEKGIDCYVDADFSSGWTQSDANNIEIFMSCTRYVITYVCSKLQSEISLSKTGAEYIALSQVMRNLIPCMELMKEV